LGVVNGTVIINPEKMAERIMFLKQKIQELKKAKKDILLV
jgi:chromosome segregation ATPase